MKIKSIKQAKKLAGEKILLRVDFNVPMEGGVIKDDYKIISSLPTIRFLLRYRCKIIIATHLGDPEKIKKIFSTKPIALYLEKLLGRKVKFINNCVGPLVEKEIAGMRVGEILVLENLRFYKKEKENDRKFAEKLARAADIYVNDAFGASHRAHDSVSAIKEYLPAYAGLLLENEILNLNKALAPKKPLVAVMGGKKNFD